MSLSSILVRSLLKNPSLPLIGTKQNRQWSWASREDVYKAIAEARYQLVNLGVEKGDRVAFKGKNSVEWIAWNMATNSLGAVWVPMYHEQNADYCHYIIQDCQPKVFINDNIDINVDVIKHPIAIESSSQYSSSIDFTHHELSTLIYTSGTTGVPKGVMLSNENIISNMTSIQKRFHDLPPFTCVNILPWAHIYSQTCELYYNMQQENAIALATSRESFIKECREIQPHTLYIVPRVLDLIKGKLTWLDKPILDNIVPFVLRYLFGTNLKYIFTGGAKLSDETKHFFTEHGYFLCEGYGCTETSPMVSVNHFISPRDLNSIGKCLEDVIVEIVNGEIQVSGPNVMMGYWNNEIASSRALEIRNNRVWYKTGDSGSMKDDFLYYHGRISENYKLSNGKFVNVQDVENTIKKHVSGNVVVFGENKSYNEVITTEPIDENTLYIINTTLDSHLKIVKVHRITTEELAPFLTPKMSIKRKPLIEYIEKRH